MDEVDVYLCHECLATFLSRVEIENHNVKTGHKALEIVKSKLFHIEDKVIALFPPS
jgi:hypothetical protein